MSGEESGKLTTRLPKHHEHIPFIDLFEAEIDRTMGLRLPEVTCKKIGGFCFGLPGRDRMTVVVKDSTHVYIYDHVEIATQGERKAQLLQADPALIDMALEFIYHVPPAIQDVPWSIWLQKKRIELKALTVEPEPGETGAVEITGAAITMADKIVREAISMGASDIHIETFRKGTIVRYRVDGVLLVENELTDRREARALIKRFKVMANIDIAQDRVTQGGRITVQLGEEGYDLRVSVVPVANGESIVMRILHKGDFHLSLEDLGFNESQLRAYKRFIDCPNGIILVSGPTGSGKSTTLFASLKSIQRPDRKLLTIEDPIEYEMPGIVQVQVNMAPTDQEKKVTFARALREFLRQDPDVILVGEIRDPETAEVSIQASLTGHLVLSTIHTNTSVGIINRLRQQGVPPFLVAACLVGGIAQRLVRRVCPVCKEGVEPTEEQVEYFRRYGITELHLSVGKGCVQCRQTGYKGRIALYEILTISEEVRDLIEREATALDITRQARKEGMQSLLEDGLSKAAQGLVTLDEVQRVCRMDF